MNLAHDPLLRCHKGRQTSRAHDCPELEIWNVRAGGAFREQRTHPLHFTDGETEAQRSRVTCPYFYKGSPTLYSILAKS